MRKIQFIHRREGRRDPRALVSMLLLGASAAACDATLGGVPAEGTGSTTGTGPGQEPAPGAGAGFGAGLGSGGDGDGDGAVVCVGAVCDPPPLGVPYNGPGEAPMRRLNVVEYENTVRDLFSATQLGVTFPEDAREDGFDTIDSALAVSEVHVDAWLDASEGIIDELFSSDPGSIAAGWCDFATTDDAANETCANQIVESFAELAWRRSLSEFTDDDPTAPYREMIEAPPGHLLSGMALETRLRTALSAILVSPRFVHRVELAGSDGALDSASLASRLSYFLWSSAPDETLLSADLTQTAVLTSEIDRMMGDPRFARFIERFPSLWLHLEKLGSTVVDASVYPNYSPELALKMEAETLAFMGGLIQNPMAPVTEMLTGESTTTDADLLALYGDSPRLGLTTQGAILTLTGAGNRTSPVRRGMWVLESILCSPPPPPPADLVAQIQEEQANVDPNLNQRERLAIHRAEPGCFNCHETMDAIGLGLENYDAMGSYRTTYPNGSLVDASGVLPGVEASFGTAEELLSLLATDERVPGCVVEKLLTYAVGRNIGNQDRGLVQAIAEISGAEAMSFSDAIVGVVTSDGFLRRAEALEEEN